MRPPRISPLSPLGALCAAQFMRRHWQKSPLLIRGAIPRFDGIIERKALFALAARDDVESRLVLRTGSPPGKTQRGGSASGWTLEHGPFRAADFKALPPTGWTLLVQGIDLHLDPG